MDKIPAYVRKQKQQSQQAGDDATAKRNQAAGAKVWKNPRTPNESEQEDEIHGGAKQNIADTYGEGSSVKRKMAALKKAWNPFFKFIGEPITENKAEEAFNKNQIGFDVARQIRKITFCGNDGDPIYCRDLAEICLWFKTINPQIQIVIITNGSYN